MLSATARSKVSFRRKTNVSAKIWGKKFRNDYRSREIIIHSTAGTRTYLDMRRLS